jgi:hypothetical protein
MILTGSDMFYPYPDPYGQQSTLAFWQWAATSMNNATEKSHEEMRDPLGYTEIGLLLFV